VNSRDIILRGLEWSGRDAGGFERGGLEWGDAAGDLERGRWVDSANHSVCDVHRDSEEMVADGRKLCRWYSPGSSPLEETTDEIWLFDHPFLPEL